VNRRKHPTWSANEDFSRNKEGEERGSEQRNRTEKEDSRLAEGGAEEPSTREKCGSRLGINARNSRES